MSDPRLLTIGVEEEYQIIDPKTRELQSYITQILEDDHLVMLQGHKPCLAWFPIPHCLRSRAVPCCIPLTFSP